MKQLIYSRIFLAFLLLQLSGCYECGFSPCPEPETVETDLSADLKKIVIIRDNACSNCPGDDNYTYGYYFQNKSATKTLTVVFKISIQVKHADGVIYNETETPTFTLKPGQKERVKCGCHNFNGQGVVDIAVISVTESK